MSSNDWLHGLKSLRTMFSSNLPLDFGPFPMNRSLNLINILFFSANRALENARYRKFSQFCSDGLRSLCPWIKNWIFECHFWPFINFTVLMWQYLVFTKIWSTCNQIKGLNASVWISIYNTLFGMDQNWPWSNRLLIDSELPFDSPNVCFSVNGSESMPLSSLILQFWLHVHDHALLSANLERKIKIRPNIHLSNIQNNLKIQNNVMKKWKWTHEYTHKATEIFLNERTYRVKQRSKEKHSHAFWIEANARPPKRRSYLNDKNKNAATYFF